MKFLKKNWLPILVWAPPIAFIGLIMCYLGIESSKFIWSLLTASNIREIEHINLDAVSSIFWIKVFVLTFVWEIIGMFLLCVIPQR